MLVLSIEHMTLWRTTLFSLLYEALIRSQLECASSVKLHMAKTEVQQGHFKSCRNLTWPFIKKKKL